jgi:predicted ATPase/DNA-binding CsgD family transcriptional regulator
MGGTHNASVKPLLEPLTRREREVLALLAHGYTAPEIAERLTVAVSSVKSHLRHLYGKLGVNSKRQALNRAEVLGLIGPIAPPAVPQHPGHKHNLPLQVTRFFGREGELAQLQERLAEHRMVTLTGSGGVGKTRLSLQAAGEILDDFSGGVWLVALAPLTDPMLVAQHVASVLGVSENPERSVIEGLKLFLRDRQVLLVLDNCEHLLEACAKLAEALLHASPNLKILASSREPLGILGEAVIGVRSMPFPNPDHLPPIERLHDYTAISLFVDRARLVLPDYQATDHNATALARICQRLDGIPLAIELAAARVNVLSAANLSERLDDAFRVLTGGSRTALPRHQTLRATLDWSYELLSEAERLLLQRLSGFAGGCTLEAAEAVCSGSGLETSQVLEVLAGLVDKSMLIAERQPEKETRYRLLEMVRQYAGELLLQAEAGEYVRRQHLTYFFALAEQAQPHLDHHDAHEVAWLDRLESDLDNLRSALGWALEHNVEAAMRLAAALFWLWQNRGYQTEGRQLLQRAVDAEARERGDVPLTAARAQVRMDAVLNLAYLMQENMERASPWFEEALALLRQLGPAGERRMAHVLLVLAKWALVRGDHAQAKALKAESLSHLPESDEYFDQESALNILAEFARAEGDFVLARSILEQRLGLVAKQGSNGALLSTLMELGEVAVRLGDEQTAKARYAESLAVALDLGHRVAANAIESELAHVARRLGHHAQARANYASTILAWQQSENPGAVAHQLECFAFIARTQSQAHRAARLLGAAETLREGTSSPMTTSERVEYDREVSFLRAQLAEPAFASAWSKGRAMTTAQAIAEALDEDAA